MTSYVALVCCVSFCVELLLYSEMQLKWTENSINLKTETVAQSWNYGVQRSCLVKTSCSSLWMSIHSSSILSHVWLWQYVIPSHSYHFLFGAALACHRGISSCSYCISLGRATTWHAVVWWDKQHFRTVTALSSEWFCFSVAGSSRQLSVLCGRLSCEAIFVTHSIWFSHMVMGCLVKPRAGPCSPVKEFLFAFMLLMGLFIILQ